jgi:homoserine dehydrogenase
MTTTVANHAGAPSLASASVSEIRVALLGLGLVGSAVAALAAQPSSGRRRFSITSALVRDVHRPRPIDTSGLPLTVDHFEPLRSRPDVLVELLGGLEPARTLVLAALAAGTPVVTANKSLLAAHGSELFAAARRYGTPLFYEASVLAGVPFLGTFGRRPNACDISGLSGIVNGTSNFIVSRMAADRVPFAEALAAAQRLGYAEPDPGKDVRGEDAVEKLCVLLRHFGGWSVAPEAVERTGIQELELQDLQQAADFGGTIRPVVSADWSHGRLVACAGPAFVPACSPLARIDGVRNALSLQTRWSGELSFSGAGAGPTATAATVLDDVVEAADGVGWALREAVAPEGACDGPETGWFIRLSSSGLANEQHAPGVLSALGVRIRRASALIARDGRHRQWLLTSPCARPHLTAALGVLSAKAACEAWSIRALD